MDELKIAFKEYVEAFKDLDTSDKRIELINSVKEVSALIGYLASLEGIDLEFLKSREILDMKDGHESEDDFLEALLVYVENAKNLLEQYLDKKNLSR